MKLKDAAIKALEPGPKEVLYSDGSGLYLRVHPSGGKSWLFIYRIGGSSKRLTLGQYPNLSLKEARKARQEARDLLDQGVDPAVKKKRRYTGTVENQFSEIAEDWFVLYRMSKAEKTISIYRNVLDMHILPELGKMPIADIKRTQLVELVKGRTLFQASKDRAKHKGKIAISTALKMCYCLGMIYKHAVNSGRIEYSVASDLSSVLPDPNYANQNTVIKPEEVRCLLQAIRQPGYANKSVWYFLNIMPYVFVRNTELRCARWDEFDLDRAEWHIPALRMKGRKQELKNTPPHFVPLASQVVSLLRQLREGATSDYLFPAAYNQNKCITDAAPLVALKRFEFSQTVHGFRTIASTYLHDLGYPTHVIEAQMAHKDRNKVRAAYNKAEYMGERIAMMQAWADYLDALVNDRA